MLADLQQELAQDEWPNVIRILQERTACQEAGPTCPPTALVAFEKAGGAAD